MKKIFLIYISLISTVLIFGQVTATGTFKSYHKQYNNIDYLFVFNGLTSSSSLKYTGNYTTINWYKFAEPAKSISNQAENFNVENASGYILDVDGVKTTIWVIDYLEYLPQFVSLSANEPSKNQCDELKLNLSANIPLMQYKSVNGATYTIDREFALSYNTKEWASDKKWNDKVITDNLKLPKSEIYLTDVPLCDTKFRIEGDQFAKDLFISPLPSVESQLYSAVRVETHITTTTAVRGELQEDERPGNASALSGSAPLDIMFLSNANTPVAKYYNWQIKKDNSLLFNRADQDQRYTFTESGTYVVKLTASNEFCSNTDSVTVKITTSDIQVPPVFTPDNGDELNDEFRVAYKSILSFKCWIFNRWGRQLYFWTDPQKGWDGTINGKKAKEGAYLYVIEAVGADGEKHSRKGVVHLLRGKQE
ncbi:MAG: gliding motility-associated C-terminal domain-containing protein [Paludibacter sp.]|nr:gliding motility-associated C-terminal domain-containing protein [Paludibacter sp.]